MSVGVSRREFCVSAAAVALGEGLCFAAVPNGMSMAKKDGYRLVAQTDKERILKAANSCLSIKPETITSVVSSRSPGGEHDFFSEADYFWPNPSNPDGPYVNRDGQSNPNNFIGHRKVMVALSIQVATLTSAWLLTSRPQYGRLACDHLRAWFATPETRMNPNLEYAQGVHGVTTGRSYGIIDTLHLVEVARAASIVARAYMSAHDYQALQSWFRDYLHWMKSSEKGITESRAKNNHAICWALQAAEFARFVQDKTTLGDLVQQYKTVFLPNQMGQDGSFPLELARTKPYSYSIFNFDVMTALCQSLTDTEPDLLRYSLPDGRGIAKAASFLFPFLEDKKRWPYAKDVEHFDALPVRSPGLLFAGLAGKHSDYIELWKRLDPDPKDAEIIRNYPVRQPLLWLAS